MKVDPRAVYEKIRSLGVGHAAAVGILANIQAESGFNTEAVGDSGTSGGLFQHHLGRWDALKQYAASTGRSWSDMGAQVEFAIREAAGMRGWDPNATDSRAASIWWTTVFERPANAQQKAQERAELTTRYEMYGTSQMGVDTTTPNPNPTGTTGTTGATVSPTTGVTYPAGYPSGMSLFRVGGKQYLLGKVGSARIYFEVDGPAPTNVAATYIASQVDWNASVANGRWINGGFGSELYSAAGQAWDAVVDQFLFESGIKGTAAEQSVEVMQAIAEKLARPDMSDAELAGRLRDTDYWRSNTESFRQWNDLSPTEQSQSIMDTAGWLAGQWFTYVGQDLALEQYDLNGDGETTSEELQRGNPDLWRWSMQVASGQKTQLQATNDFLKPEAKKDPDSPWSRTLKNELKAQGEEEVNIAGAAQEVQRLYRRYGIEVSLTQAKIEGEQIALNQMTFPDLEEKLKDVATGLYPLKPRDIDVETYSSPYRQTFENMLEIPEPGIFDRSVQNAMNAGLSLADFKDMLRKDERWQTTDNAREEYVQTYSALGSRMGF